MAWMLVKSVDSQATFGQLKWRCPKDLDVTGILEQAKKNPTGETSGESYCWWLKSCTSWYGKYPVIYTVFYITGGARFLPSTVGIHDELKVMRCLSDFLRNVPGKLPSFTTIWDNILKLFPSIIVAMQIQVKYMLNPFLVCIGGIFKHESCKIYHSMADVYRCRIY